MLLLKKSNFHSYCFIRPYFGQSSNPVVRRASLATYTEEADYREEFDNYFRRIDYYEDYVKAL